MKFNHCTIYGAYLWNAIWLHFFWAWKKWCILPVEACSAVLKRSSWPAWSWSVRPLVLLEWVGPECTNAWPLPCTGPRKNQMVCPSTLLRAAGVPCSALQCPPSMIAKSLHARKYLQLHARSYTHAEFPQERHILLMTVWKCFSVGRSVEWLH